MQSAAVVYVKMVAGPQVTGPAPHEQPLQGAPLGPVRSVVAVAVLKPTGQAALAPTLTPGEPLSAGSMGTHWARVGTQSGSAQSIS
jgi:hypothetical protein